MILSMDKVRRACRLKNPIVRETLAELIGTITLVFVGNSAIANNIANPETSSVNVPLGYATALALAVYVAGGVSGGHVNPTVTLGLCLTGRCDLNRLLPFTVAQFIGGFIGAALTHGLFFDLFQLDPNHEAVALYKVFATYPNGEISIGGAFLDQVMGTALLLFGIMAVTDRRNMKVPKGALPAAIGMVLFGVITSTSSNTGAALNPARDFSPRLYSYIIGYHEVFKAGDHFFWIPIVACYIGSVVGAFLYFFCIEVHHAPENEGEDLQADYELETDAKPTRPTRLTAPTAPTAPKHGQQNDGYRREDDFTRGDGLPKSDGYRSDTSNRGNGSGRDNGYRGDGYRRDNSPRGNGYM